MGLISAARLRTPSPWLGALKLSPLLAAGAWQMSAALSYPNLWWLRYVALIPLFVGIRFLPRHVAASCGAFWGATLYLISQAEPTAGVRPSAWLLLTIIPAAFAWAGTEITRRRGFHPLLLGLCWAVVELIVAPLATQHGLLASTRGEGIIAPALGHLAGGYILAAFLLAAINALLVSALLRIDQTITGSPFLTVPVAPGWILVGSCVISLPTRFATRIRPRAPPLPAFA